MTRSVECQAFSTGLERINRVISWKNIEASLMDYHDIGTSKEGADAHPPLMLLLPALRAESTRFTTIFKNIRDTMSRQTCVVKCEAYFTDMAFNLFRGSKLLMPA